jgi:hypothetical protein
MTDGLEVFVQLVIAAITTEPWLNWTRSLPSWTLTSLAGRSGRGDIGAATTGTVSSLGARAPGAADLGGSLAGKLVASSWSCLP